MGTDGFSNSSHWWPATDRSYMNQWVFHTSIIQSTIRTGQRDKPLLCTHGREGPELGLKASRRQARETKHGSAGGPGAKILVAAPGNSYPKTTNGWIIPGMGFWGTNFKPESSYRCTLGAVWHASPIAADIFEQFDAFPPRFPSDPTNPSFLTNPTCRAFQAVGTSPMVTQI